MPNPRSSLIVPFYDVEPYIDACLASIECQTMADLEVLLVDDGSTDGSRAIAESYCRRDGRFQLHAQTNQGLAAARNAGAAEASGEYLMFVDSDDLLPPRALELLVSRLDSTGSSLAVGNARRFDLAVTEPSWGQSRSAASDRDRTTLASFPPLATDRIACNKMFRRSFWSDYGYSFPKIRYEDYPVVLAALLDAPAIDCVSAPVYFWRRRESGASITQRSHDVDNAFDRLASAQLVLDLAQRRASPPVEREVHSLLGLIDLPALLLAFADAKESEMPRLMQELTALVRRLDTPAVRPKSGLLALQLQSLKVGDQGMLQALARHRQSVSEPNDATRMSPRRPWRREFVLPGAEARPKTLPERLYLVPLWRQKLATSVDQIHLEGGELVVRGAAAIAFTTQEPVVTVRAQSRGRVLSARVSHESGTGNFEARFDWADLVAADAERWELVVGVRHRWLRRSGPLVHLESSTRPVSRVFETDAGRILRVGIDRTGAAGVEVLRNSPAATTVHVADSNVCVRLEQDACGPMVLRRDDGSVIALDPGELGARDRGLVKIDLMPLLEEPPADNPATGTASYELVDADSGNPVLAPITGPAERWTSEGWTVAATRSATGALVLERSASVPIADTLEIIDDRLVLFGSGTTPTTLEWRAGATGPAAAVDVEVVGHRWRAAVRTDALADLLLSIDQRQAPSAFAYADGRPIRLDGFAIVPLPLYALVPAGQIRVGLRGTTAEVTLR